MPCSLEAYGDKCECSSGFRFGLPKQLGCELWYVQERPYDATDYLSIDNWKQLPLQTRQRCVKHLRRSLLAHRLGPIILQRWHRQYRDGMAPGSDQPNFHFGAGMAVRNILRQVCPDGDLMMSYNWDDFYIGAIWALQQEDA